MRSILLLLALAACSPPPAARRATRSPDAPPGAAREPAPPPATAAIRPLVSHLAPGDPVVVAIDLAGEGAAATPIESLEVVLAGPDGTTQRASAPAGASAAHVDLTAGGGLDLSLAGRYRLSLAGLSGGRRFTAGDVEIEVMGDGRLPLAEIERRARLALARRNPPPAPGSAVVSEEPGGDRVVRVPAAGAVYVVRLSPAGAVRGVETEPRP